MRVGLGGVLVACASLTASAVAAQNDANAPITTALAVEPAAQEIEAVPPIWVGRLPLPRMRPASAPRPPEPNSPEDVCNTLADSARTHRLPIAFFGNLIYQESGLKPRIVSRAGARGIAQFMPGTARSVGLKHPFNPREALPASAKFLRGLLHRFGNNYGLAAAAYNAGPGAVSRWLKHRSRLPRETRNYVLTITGKRPEQWRGTSGNSFANNLKAQVPCRNLRAFAALENNPASAHALRPVVFVLPLPLPNPLRPTLQQVALPAEKPGESAPLMVNIEMRMPMHAPTPPAAAAGQPTGTLDDLPTASIAPELLSVPAREIVALLRPAQAHAAEAPVQQPIAASASEETSDVTPTMIGAIKISARFPLPRANPHHPAEHIASAESPETEIVGQRLARLPLPRANPHRPAELATAFDVPVSAADAERANLPLPRANPQRLPEHVAAADLSDRENGAALIGRIPMPHANPRRPSEFDIDVREHRVGDDASKDTPKDLARLPLPRAKPHRPAERVAALTPADAHAAISNPPLPRAHPHRHKI